MIPTIVWGTGNVGRAAIRAVEISAWPSGSSRGRRDHRVAVGIIAATGPRLSELTPSPWYPACRV